MNASVSAVIPCFRCAKTIVRAVESVARQTLLPAEVILVDDGSGDDTAHTLIDLQHTFGEDWVKVISLESNRGVSVARNVGWDAALQEYVAFLDADDVWHPQKIELQYVWMKEHPRVDLTGHDYALESLERLQGWISIHPDYRTHSVTIRRLLFSNPFTPSTVMLKRSLPQRFDPAKRFCEDHLLWLEMAFDGLAMAQLTTVLAYKNLGTGTPSRDLWKMRKSDLDNYHRLWREGKLNLFVASALYVFSMLKFGLHFAFGTRLHFGFKRWIEND